jgi:hypothetical protein
VQRSTFGRLLDGEKDELVGFESSLVKIADPDEVAASGRTHNANVIFNGRADGRVSGMAFDITDTELVKADQYELEADYERIGVTLASGKEAWVYVHHDRQHEA